MYPYLECQAALGMESGAISDGQISAFSQQDANHAATYGRLNFQKSSKVTRSWVAATNDVHQWLQVDLGKQHTTVTLLATQGAESHWVTEYKLQYSDDGIKFQYYIEQGQNVTKVR